jgi:hypothetical protein
MYCIDYIPSSERMFMNDMEAMEGRNRFHFRYCFNICLETLRKNTKPSVWIAYTKVENQTRILQYNKKSMNHHTATFGENSCNMCSCTRILASVV